MAKFNTLSTNPRKTTNYEGGDAYTLDAETELYSAAVTSLLEDTYYESKDKRLRRIQDLVQKCDDTFVGQLAIYAREQMYLRSIPIVLTVELAKKHNGDRLVSNVIHRIVQRADEITEVLAYYQIANNRTATKKLSKLSKQIQKGLAECFNKFDEYAFAKYNRDKDVKLKDALFLVHPKPKDENQQLLFNKIVSDTLETPDTWEVKISQAGQDGTSPKEVWEELISNKKLGYMASLRNIRNMLDDGVSDEHLKMVADYISNEKAVLNGKQLPYRYFSAWQEIQLYPSFKVEPFLNALNTAMSISSRNINGFDDNMNIVVSCDMSGSMDDTMSSKSKITRQMVGLILGASLRQRCEKCIISLFGDTHKAYNSPKGNILGTVSSFLKEYVGYSTNGHLAIDFLISQKLKTDKVFIFTDCQLWDSNTSNYGSIGGSIGNLTLSWNKYKSTDVGKDSKLYLFDLAGYSTTPIDMIRSDVYLISGFSDKIFQVLNSLENKGSALDEIKEIRI